MAAAQAARHAYEDARLRGLCEEGAIEASFAAIEQLDASALQQAMGQAVTTDATAMTMLTSGWHIVSQQGGRLAAGLECVTVAQPAGGVVNHPAWTLSHLAHYHPAILSLLRGEPVADPAEADDAQYFDEGSVPVLSPQTYLPWADLLAKYTRGHEAITQALACTTPGILASPPGLPRWARSFPTTADLLAYLMLIHESQHQGQLMAWRRAMGMPL